MVDQIKRIDLLRPILSLRHFCLANLGTVGKLLLLRQDGIKIFMTNIPLIRTNIKIGMIKTINNLFKVITILQVTIVV